MKILNKKMLLTDQPAFRMGTFNYRQKDYGLFGIALFYTFIMPDNSNYLLPVVSDACIDLMFYKNHKLNDCGADIIGPRTIPYDLEFKPGYSYFGVRFLSGYSPLISELRLPDVVEKKVSLSEACLEKSIVDEITCEWEFETQITKFLKFYGLYFEKRNVSGKRELSEYIIKQILWNSYSSRLQYFENNTGYTKQYINKVFQEETGFSVMKFDKILRVQRVIQDVFENSPGWQKKTFAQVALDLGYSDQSHMIREFKRYVGATPHKYREGLHI